jgi:hypothetical protein
MDYLFISLIITPLFSPGHDLHPHENTMSMYTKIKILIVYINSLSPCVCDEGFGGWGKGGPVAATGDSCQFVTGCDFAITLWFFCSCNKMCDIAIRSRAFWYFQPSHYVLKTKFSQHQFHQELSDISSRQFVFKIS